MKHFLYLILFAWLVCPFSFAQENVALDKSAVESESKNVESLEALLKSVSSKAKEVTQLQTQLSQPADEVTKAELVKALTKAKEEEEALNQKFEKFAVAVDISDFLEEPTEEFDLQKEFEKILQPIVTELKSATSESREIGELKSAVEEYEAQSGTASQAVVQIETRLSSNPSPELQSILTELKTKWERRSTDLDNQEKALRLQLENRLAQRESLLDSTTGFFQNFFRSRGLNLLMGVGSFALVFFSFRFLNWMFHKLRRGKKPKKNFTNRLGALVYQMSSVIAALLACLLVFNMVGDWFLLGIILIFLLGAAWASINTIPQHIETVKLLLNIGAVREGERIVFDGIAWKVNALNFRARLVNPLLDGGVQELPIKELVGLHSRPVGDKEEWFPCREGDWVELSDGRIGRVTYQNPGTVQLVELGGAQIIYPTSAFLEQTPKNMSTNFRIETKFGIDYKHQAIATTEVPAKMQAALEREMIKVIAQKDILDIKVEFMEAATSSLDYEIEVDVRGKAAAKYEQIQFAIQRILVDACNEHGWEIPFQQITIHQNPSG